MVAAIAAAVVTTAVVAVAAVVIAVTTGIASVAGVASVAVTAGAATVVGSCRSTVIPCILSGRRCTGLAGRTGEAGHGDCVRRRSRQAHPRLMEANPLVEVRLLLGEPPWAAQVGVASPARGNDVTAVTAALADEVGGGGRGSGKEGRQGWLLEGHVHPVGTTTVHSCQRGRHVDVTVAALRPCAPGVLRPHHRRDDGRLTWVSAQ